MLCKVLIKNFKKAFSKESSFQQCIFHKNSNMFSLNRSVEISLRKPILNQYIFCAAYFSRVTCFYFLHVIVKRFHNENIARKITDCCFQGFYLLQVFSISKAGCPLVQYIVFNILRNIVHNILANVNGLTIYDTMFKTTSVVRCS